MDLSISAGTTRADIQLQGGMVTATFAAGTPQEFSPTFTAQWDGFSEAPILDKLRGDFFCLPFGAAPASAEDLPADWRAGYAGESPWIHGPSSNLDWSIQSAGEQSAVLVLEYPADSPVERVERHVSCSDDAVNFVDQIYVRRDCRLPVGVHPMVSLPEEAGKAQLRLPEVESFWALPLDSGTTVLELGAVFDDITCAPRADGSTIDLSRLPLDEKVDEIVLAAGVKDGTITLVNEASGYSVSVVWDRTYLKHALLWISNRGRQALPWGGQNLCLGIEPITAAFDFGEGVSAGPNPLARAGFDTAIDFTAGEVYEVRHSITATRID